LLGLFEEHFFIAIVAAEADIYKQRIIEWIKEQKNFQTLSTHARYRSKINRLLKSVKKEETNIV